MQKGEAHFAPIARGAGLVACVLLLSCRVAPTGTLIGPSVGAQPWWLVRSTHFTVRSDVGQTEAREIAIDLERTYRILFDLGFPMEKDPGLFTDVIVFRRADDYKLVGPKGSGGYFTREFGLWGSGGPTFLTFGGLSDASRPIFVHELAHRFIRYAFPQAPVWLNEGLATYFESIAVDGGKAVLGRSRNVFKRGDSWTMGSYGIPIDVLPSFQEMREMDAKTFYAARDVPEGSKEGDEAQKAAARWQKAHYMSAWAMVQILKNGTPENATRLQRWLEKMAAGQPAQASFDEAFSDVSMDELESQRRAFLERHVTGEIALLRTDYDAKSSPPAEDRAMRPAEVNLLWGWAHLEVAQGGPAEVRRYAEAALEAEPSSAEAHLLMAAVYLLEKDPAQAVNEIQAAVRADPGSEPAATALFEFQANPPRGARSAPDTRAQADATLAKWLGRAKHSTTLNNFAWYMTLHGRAEEAVPVARRSTQLDPSCADCFDTVALALFRSGQYKAAVEVEELAAGLVGEGRWSDELFERAALYRAVNSALVIWKKRPEPGKDPSILPASVIEAINAAQRPYVLGCYLRRLRKDQPFSGAVVVRGEISKDGKVTARALSPDEWDGLAEKPALPPLAEPAVTECIVEQLAATRFPESSATTAFTTPVLLEPPRKKK
jgi:tetratricopeptide (TPR) repeat protein